MIVLCVGMYRSCSTWQYGVASLLLERHRGGRRLGFIDGSRFVETSVADQATMGWQTMKAHDAHPCFDEILDRRQALAIFAHRDIRDVALSWMHMTGASFEEVTQGGFLRLCLDNDRFWRTRPGVLVQTYESIVAEPDRAVAEVADHLGVDLAPEEARAIAEEMSRDANRRRIEKLNDKLRAEGTELLPQDLTLFDPNSLLHWNHIRDGRTGAWRESFSPEQCLALGRICGNWLVERGYEVDESWAGASHPEPGPASQPPIPHISYASDAEDILLDRLFRGQVGSYLDIGAGHPTRENRSFYFYLRGWRGLNITQSSESHHQFRTARPEDLNLSLVLSEVEDRGQIDEVAVPERPTRTVAGLVAQYHLSAPAIVSIDVAEDVTPILRGMPLDAWKPKVFVIADRTLADPDRECILQDHGYIRARSDGINHYFLRGDLEAALPLLQAPIDSRDRFERSDLVLMREECHRLGDLIESERRDFSSACEDLKRERDAAVAGLTGERDHALSVLEELARENQRLLTYMAQMKGMLDTEHAARVEHEAARIAEQAARIEEQTARIAEQAARVIEQAAHLAERERFDRERARDAATITELESERDDLRLDCATWEREATRRARTATEGDSAFRSLEAGRASDRSQHDLEGERFELDRRRFAEEREKFQIELAEWARERSYREGQVAEYQRLLRPYRMIDRLGVVGAVHHQARKLKRVMLT